MGWGRPIFLMLVPCLICVCLENSSVLGTREKKTHADFEAEIAALETMRGQTYPTGGFLFTGSSSIRKWDLSKAFPSLHAVNMGFGGSRMVDLNHFADRIVFPYKPAMIVVYEGDNDIHEGFVPWEVILEFRLFLDSVKSRLPGSRVLFLAVKPCPSRFREMQRQRQLNRHLKDWCDNSGGLASFVDTFTPILGPDGTPDRSFFQDDQLHLNDKGYARWKSALDPLLK